MMNIINDPTAEPSKIGNPPPSRGVDQIVENISITSRVEYRNHVKGVWLWSFFVFMAPMISGPKALIVSQKIIQPIVVIFSIVSIIKDLNYKEVIF